MIAQRKPDFPFMLCWANENWSRNWDGGFDKLLLQQDYSVEDDRLHMEHLCKNIFSDYRYIQIDGKPVFAIYRTEYFPDISASAEVWDEVCRQYGFNGIYLIKMESLLDRTPPEDIGFDAAMEFQPEWANLPEVVPMSFTEKVLHKSAIFTEKVLHRSLLKKNPKCYNYIFEYSGLIEKAINKKPVNYKRFPGITPMWDNTARRPTKGGIIFKNSTPELYGKWLKHIVDHFTPFSENENFVFINAWNEWAEGNHLEPCRKWGKQYLEVTQKIIADAGSIGIDS
jgi:hypothetical protein